MTGDDCTIDNSNRLLIRTVSEMGGKKFVSLRARSIAPLAIHDDDGQRAAAVATMTTTTAMMRNEASRIATWPINTAIVNCLSASPGLHCEE
ncbi:hypothetical protein ALC60_12401 [Trachymyrmex zeteki]|uniref:Uncharacterized protein n=1 Tax=Mycetomoellerius zeteki TaxID=64791 RepID=A0A151WLJ0_9HYME|nr:hypothetical protein ALC60_12401 [Trachymyrmex zeteki]